MFHAPRLGGDAISEHIAARTQDFSSDLSTAPEPFTFAFDELEVRAYLVEAPVPHYLYVTFGLSRVRSSVPVAGTQTELTMRVPHSGPVPFAWPAEQLATMVASVWRSGNDIAPGHHFTAKNLPGGFLFITDPVLGHIDPPTGIVRFTQALWVTPDELEGPDPRKVDTINGEITGLTLAHGYAARASYSVGVRYLHQECLRLVL